MATRLGIRGPSTESSADSFIHTTSSVEPGAQERHMKSWIPVASGSRVKATSAALTFLLLLSSCEGQIGDPELGNGRSNGSGSGGGSPAGPGATTGPGTGGGTVPPPLEGFTPEVAGLRRLTLPQYKNSVHELFGDAVKVANDFEPDTALSGFASIGAARVGLSAHIVGQFETSALDIAKQVLV